MYTFSTPGECKSNGTHFKKKYRAFNRYFRVFLKPWSSKMNRDEQLTHNFPESPTARVAGLPIRTRNIQKYINRRGKCDHSLV